MFYKTIQMIAAVMIATTASAQTIVNNPDGTISLKGNTLVPYTVDPSKKFRVSLESDASTETASGIKRTGTPVAKGELVTVRVTQLLLDNQPNIYQVWNSSDVMIGFDPDKLELYDTTSTLVDPAVVNVAKISANLEGNGIVRFHSELVTPNPARPYVFNLGGYLWNGGRTLGNVRFKVKGDFYLPQSTTNLWLYPNSTISYGTVKPAGPVGELVSNVNKITFCPSPSYLVDLKLVESRIGDNVSVRIYASPQKPQIIYSVKTLFAWDKTKLEFMGIDKTNAKPSQSSILPFGGVNESSIPKDGTALHVFWSVLGDKAPLATDVLIVTLNFKIVAPFTETTVEIIGNTDPRLGGIIVDDTSISSIRGANVLGSKTGITIKGN